MSLLGRQDDPGDRYGHVALWSAGWYTRPLFTAAATARMAGHACGDADDAIPVVSALDTGAATVEQLRTYQGRLAHALRSQVSGDDPHVPPRQVFDQARQAAGLDPRLHHQLWRRWTMTITHDTVTVAVNPVALPPAQPLPLARIWPDISIVDAVEDSERMLSQWTWQWCHRWATTVLTCDPDDAPAFALVAACIWRTHAQTQAHGADHQGRLPAGFIAMSPLIAQLATPTAITVLLGVPAPPPPFTRAWEQLKGLDPTSREYVVRTARHALAQWRNRGFAQVNADRHTPTTTDMYLASPTTSTP